MNKLINKKIIIFLLALVLSLGFFQFTNGITKGIGQTATITVSCSDSDGNLSECNVTSPCTKNCSASGSSGSCSCGFTCTTVAIYDACGKATDTKGLTDTKCTTGAVICNDPPVANAGLDKEVWEGDSVILEGSGSDPNGDPMTFSWVCVSPETDVQEQWNGAYDMQAGGRVRMGQRKILSNKQVYQLSFLLNKDTGATGDVTFSIRRTSNDSVIVNKVWGDASALTTFSQWQSVTFDSFPTINEEVYALCEFSGSGFVWFGLKYSDVKAGENLVVYITSYTSLGYDAAYRLKYLGGAVEPATGTVDPVTGAATTTFTAPLIDANTTYTCMLTIADDKGSSDYDSVNILVKNNYPPTANICCQSCSSPNCTAYTGEVFTLINDSHDQNGDTDIVKSEWDILNWKTDPDLSCSPPNALCNFTPQFLSRGTYTVELYVEDSKGTSATDQETFTIKQSAIADFKCSLDNTNWKTCSDIKPNVGEVVYFLDQSSPPQGGSITSYSWTFQNGNPSTATGTNPSTKFQSAGQKEVTLTLGVTAGPSDSRTQTIGVELPLPEWQEIPPF